ncbi:hypothetical protein ACFWN2_30345 [Lentzea sp. NPDC058436]|uniref:hypothetical protein n=1 Tax=Lentzea sp. NPDC058436 TaxID=3346499 RepID=UPI00364ED453
MNRSLALVTIAAALGLAACTSTPDTAAPTPSGTTTAPPPVEVVTEVVTATVTNPPQAAVKVDNRLGYGALKLGMTLEEARATGLTALTWDNGGNDPDCVADDHVAISKKHGVVRITLPAGARTSKGIGVGSTYAEVKAAYQDASEYDDGWSAVVAGNAVYSFVGSPDLVYFGDTDEVFRIKLGATGADCSLALL